MPSFTLQNVQDFHKSTISLADFRGKWLILNFWYRGCVSSIKNLSKANELGSVFQNQIQFILIGVNDAISFGDGIGPLYKKLREKMGLRLPNVQDSTLSQRWHIMSFPHIIIIDPNGIVKAITNGSDLTQERLGDLVQGRPVDFFDKEIEQPQFNGNDASPNMLAYRSILSRWNGQKQSIPTVLNRIAGTDVPGYRASCVPLYQLFNLAYYGRPLWFSSRDSLYRTVYSYPFIEAKDTALFTYDYESGQGIYNYELIIRQDSVSKEEIMRIMQSELKNIFNLEASVEGRPMRVWKLISQADAANKLKTKRNSSRQDTDINGDGGAGGFSLHNTTTNVLLDLLTRYITDYKTPFFDETGISHRIDITIDALMTDRKQIVRELQRYGLDLITDEKIMTVLAIRRVRGL